MPNHSEPFDSDQTKMAVAALAACIVQTLRESDPSFQERFLTRLEGWYATLREDRRTNGLDCLETLAWTKEMISGDRP